VKRPYAPYFVVWYSCDVVCDVLRRCGVTLRGARALEAGCGGGGMLFRLCRHVAHLTGADVSGDTIELLRRHYLPHFPNVDLVACDFAAWRPDRRFDLVLSNDCFEHVADAAGFLRTAARCLEPGGTMCLQFPNDPTHGVNHYRTLGELRRAVGASFGSARVFRVVPSGYQELLHRLFAWLRAKASPSFARVRQEVLDDPRTRGLDDFARSACFRYLQREAGGGVRFRLARWANGLFRLLERAGPRHRIVELTARAASADVVGMRLVVVARGPRAG